MNFRLKLIASLLLLVYLNCNAQNQYIAKHFAGDDIPLDSFVVMDFGTYNGIRKGAQLYEQLAGTDSEIIEKSDSIINQFNNLVQANNLRLDYLMLGIDEREQVIKQLNLDIRELSSINTESIRQMRDMNKQIKRPWLSVGFWSGLAIGVIGTTILLR